MELQRQLEALTRLGVQPVAVSADSPQSSAALAASLGLGFPVLGDPSLEVISAWRGTMIRRWGSPGRPCTWSIADRHIAWFAVAEGTHSIDEALVAARRLTRR